ncbi:MAG: DUF58 domain-containing protein [Paludibacteraceae bacterium]|nr:DUF58 domain-containing protein [Paludibacteraceae bacterium]
MFLGKRTVYLLIAIVAICAVGWLWLAFLYIGLGLLGLLVFAVVADLLRLTFADPQLVATRELSDRFSNGDPNPVCIRISSQNGRTCRLQVYDEIPPEFQVRDLEWDVEIAADRETVIRYTLTPTRRGSYGFGLIHAYLYSPWKLMQRHYKLGEPMQTHVYPSFFYLKQLEKLSVDNYRREFGIHSVRRIGNNREFEEIKEYVKGDDYRTINWKATARRDLLLCNVYADEQSQCVYSMIDKGRGMQHSFNGMTLLDYAINASICLSYTVLRHGDLVGLISFNWQIDQLMLADKRHFTMKRLQEMLHNEDSTFLQSDYNALYECVRHRITRRSLLILYTTFDTLAGLKRELPYLRKLAQGHVLLVVFFRDRDLEGFESQADNRATRATENALAASLAFEKQLVAQALQQHGIQTLLTTPEKLRESLVNKYLELKRRNLL